MPSIRFMLGYSACFALLLASIHPYFTLASVDSSPAPLAGNELPTNENRPGWYEWASTKSSEAIQAMSKAKTATWDKAVQVINTARTTMSALVYSIQQYDIDNLKKSEKCPATIPDEIKKMLDKHSERAKELSAAMKAVSTVCEKVAVQGTDTMSNDVKAFDAFQSC